MLKKIPKAKCSNKKCNKILDSSDQFIINDKIWCEKHAPKTNQKIK